jgi:hypothetical protein
LIRYPKALKNLDSGSTHCRNDRPKNDFIDRY